jgi:hypothetical protein
MPRFKQPLGGLSRLSDRVGGKGADIEVVGTSYNRATYVSEVVVDIPAGAREDDVLVVCSIAGSSASVGPYTDSTRVRQGTFAVNAVSLTGMEGGSIVLPKTGSSTTVGWAAILLRNVRSLQFGPIASASTTAALPLLHSYFGAKMLIAAIGNGTNNSDQTATGFSLQVKNPEGQPYSCYLLSKDVDPSIGYQDTASFATASSASRDGVLLGIS